MSYQAVIRNPANNLVANQAVGMKISILQGTESGSAVYVETQTPTTNTNGLISLKIGDGTVVSGTFATIDWTTGPYFIKTETDPAGGENYTITGVSQLLSVPYALYAAASGTPGAQGATCKSAYQLAQDNGFVGDETAWLNSLKGEKGNDGAKGDIGDKGSVPNGTVSGEMMYWNGTAWVGIAPGSSGSKLFMVQGKPTWVPEIGPNDVFNPVTGKVWMDRNLGASQVATSYNYAASYGDLYQWGRGTDGHEKRTSATTNTLNNTDNPGHGSFIISDSPPYDWQNTQNYNLWQGVNGINNPCPTGYRVPTSA
ncbi:hypothetical protein MASR2M117_16000 [Paludibacter sp.]